MIRRLLVVGRFPLAAGALALLWGCAPIPPPAVLADADSASTSRGAVQSKELAPQAYAHAEQLRLQAHQAFEREDLAQAQFLAEHAIAAYAHARALSRVSRAQKHQEQAEDALETAEGEQAVLDGQMTRVTAELDAIELKVKVLEELEKPAVSGPTSPERERARREAAVALAVQARLLCGAASLLVSAHGKSGSGQLGDGVVKSIDEATKGLDGLEADLKDATVTPIDRASRVRASCLSALTLVRRAQTATDRATGVGDQLLAELSATKKYAPSRDDRGVYVTLRGPFAGGGLSPSGAVAASELARVAAAHPRFPVAIVLHDLEGHSAGVEALAKAFRDAGVSDVRVDDAGKALPLVDPRGRRKSQNARVDVVFVTPETF